MWASWSRAVCPLGGDQLVAKAAGSELVVRYAEPHRRYHDGAHALAVMRDAATLADGLRLPPRERCGAGGRRRSPRCRIRRTAGRGRATQRAVGAGMAGAGRDQRGTRGQGGDADSGDTGTLRAAGGSDGIGVAGRGLGDPQRGPRGLRSLPPRGASGVCRVRRAGVACGTYRGDVQPTCPATAVCDRCRARTIGRRRPRRTSPENWGLCERPNDCDR